jgi:predicted site-specific integrase-resolvase
MVGKSVITLQRWDRDGILVAHRTETNRRFYTHDQYLETIGIKATGDKKILAYCRVSSAGQKTDLKSQVMAVEQYCGAKGYAISELIEEVGSGLNYTRKKYNALLEQVEMGEISIIIVAHKDRLVRFGFEWFETFCKRHGTTIEVMNQQSLSPEQEMTQDLLSIVHCFSSRLYGLRKYKNKLKQIIETSQSEDVPSKDGE